MHKKSLFFFTLTLISLLTQGCSTIIGTTKPVSDKSHDYQFLDLSEGNTNWSKIEQPIDDEATEKGISDIAFKSKKTESIIALNSACRPINELNETNLESFSDQLFLGVSEIKNKTTKHIAVSSTPALETTLEGTMNSKSIKLRTIVLQKQTCIYDIMYLSYPHFFQLEEKEFNRFVSAIRL